MTTSSRLLSHRVISFGTFAATHMRPRRLSMSSRRNSNKLRIGFVPEHFSTPLYFAHKHFGLNVELVPEPLGTGALASRLKAEVNEETQVDVAVGLTEGFINDLGKAKAAGQNKGYKLVGTYVESPLCWAISTGRERGDITDVDSLKGKRVGVSRMGSGSFIMSQVLADQKGWLRMGQEPFPPVVIGDFAALRKAVSGKAADFFMWEHFTTKYYWDNGELKRIGEIYTPWPSWMIAARDDAHVDEVLEKINQGVKHYLENEDEAVEYITNTMHYSKEDARSWMKTVKFAGNVRGIDPMVVDRAAALLKKAGALDDDTDASSYMVAIRRA